MIGNCKYVWKKHFGLIVLISIVIISSTIISFKPQIWDPCGRYSPEPFIVCIRPFFVIDVLDLLRTQHNYY